MENTSLYHDGMRQLQDVRETRSLADRLEQVTVRSEFTEEDRLFIEGSSMVFVATADTHGHPDCSYKGLIRNMPKPSLEHGEGKSFLRRIRHPNSTSTANFHPSAQQAGLRRVGSIHA